MSTISVTLPADGDTIDASDVNNPINTIVTAINGNLDSNNISAGGVATSNLATDIQITTKEKNPYKFSVYRNAASTTSSAGAVVPFDTKLYDTGTNIDVVTNKGRFTAPIAGFYCFSGGMSIQAAATSGVFLSLYKNGTELFRAGALYNASGSTQTLGPALPAIEVSLAANDYIELFCTTSTNTETINVGSTPVQTFFNGFLVSAT